MANGSYTSSGNYNSSTSSTYYSGWQFTGAWSGVLSGLWYSGSNRQGYNGLWWSSTAYSSTYAWSWYIRSAYVGPANGYNKWYGFAARCVLP